jgi:hypothetical protein
MSNICDCACFSKRSSSKYLSFNIAHEPIIYYHLMFLALKHCYLKVQLRGSCVGLHVYSLFFSQGENREGSMESTFYAICTDISPFRLILKILEASGVH